MNYFGREEVADVYIHAFRCCCFAFQVRKNMKYGADIADQPCKYQQIYFDALGGFSEPARCCIGTIAKRACKKINVPKSVVILSMTREISAILARGAASLALRRMVSREQSFIDC